MVFNLLEEADPTERRSPPQRRATVDVLDEHLLNVQRVGQWLARETHGDAYVPVRELNVLLHQARQQLRTIRARMTDGGDWPGPG